MLYTLVALLILVLGLPHYLAEAIVLATLWTLFAVLFETWEPYQSKTKTKIYLGKAL